MKSVYDASVIVTAYNQNEVLEIVLKALQMQRFDGSWEIVVCDDGSEQDTLDVVERAARAPGPPIRFVWQPRKGERRARTRNNGLRCASGRVVILLDGDIAVKPDFISTHVASHTGGRTATYGPRYWVSLADLPEESKGDRFFESFLLQDVDVSGMLTEVDFQGHFANTPHAWAGCFSSNLSLIPGAEPILFDEKFEGWGSEDQEYSCRLQHLHHYKLQFMPSLYGFHLEHRSQCDFTKIRARSHAEIVTYIRNILYCCSLYPALDMTAACLGLASVEFDPEHGVWRSAKETRMEIGYVLSVLATAREWWARTHGTAAPIDLGGDLVGAGVPSRVVGDYTP